MIRETLTPESSRIYSIGHDPKTNTLEVCFWQGKGEGRKAGPVYRYANVTADQHAAFMAAESKGGHFGQHFQKNEAHPYVKLEAQAAEAAAKENVQ